MQRDHWPQLHTVLHVMCSVGIALTVLGVGSITPTSMVHADRLVEGSPRTLHLQASSALWAILQSSQNFSYGSAMYFSWGESGDIVVPGDYDGDELADPTVRRPPAGGQSAAYLMLLSSTGYDYGQSLIVPAGWPSLGDTPVVGDFNRDWISEPAIWRGSTGVWIIPLSPSFSTYAFYSWGTTGDKPVAADVDGDGCSDIGYFRPSNGSWGFLLSSHNYAYGTPQYFSWGSSTDIPVMADFDGDHKADPAVVIPPAGGQSQAYRILLSTTNYNPALSMTIPAGWPGLGDTPVPGDYEGDGKADGGIWRASTGVWIIPLSSTNNNEYLFAAWGVSGDIPALGDYDGDSTADLAIYSLSTPPPYSHAWYINNPDSSTWGAMFALGQSDGAWDNSNCNDSMVILNFGQVGYEAGGQYDGYGTHYFDQGHGYPFVSDTTIEQAAERYAAGWFGATGTCPRLKLVVGLNNYVQCPNGGACSPYAAGQQWGLMINNIRYWLVDQRYDWQITVWAGDDMEQPGGGEAWDCADRTRNFVDGFDDHNPAGANLIDYGTAWLPNSCWSSSDVYYVAYGRIANWPLPEIYTTAATDSWIEIRASYFMKFLGILTECKQDDPITGDYCSEPTGDFSPTGGWWDLWSKLNNTGFGQATLNYAANLANSP